MPSALVSYTASNGLILSAPANADEQFMKAIMTERAAASCQPKHLDKYLLTTVVFPLGARGWQELTIKLCALACVNYTPLQVPIDGLRKYKVFNLKYLTSECLSVISVRYSDSRLQDCRTAIKFIGYVVHSGSRFFITRIDGSLMRIQTCVFRQQRRVNVHQLT
jgi:hypothetical protein